MDKIKAKFVHGEAEFIREIEVDSADAPPPAYTLTLPGGYHEDRESEPEQPWEAVYVREPNTEPESQWIYRYRGTTGMNDGDG